MTQGLNRRAIIITSLVWLGVIAAAIAAASIRQINIMALVPVIIAASVPAILGLLVVPWGKREWAQIIIILAWLSLAVLSCVFVGLMPMVALFLAAPVIAALFKQEKIIESLILASILAGCFYLASINGMIPKSPLTAEQSLWAKQVGVIGVAALIISALFVRAHTLDRQTYRSLDSELEASNSVYESLCGCVLRFNKQGQLILANSESEKAFDLDLSDQRLTIDEMIKEKFFNSAVMKNTIQKSLDTQKNEEIQFKSFVSEITRSFDSFIFPQKDGGFVLHAIDRTAEETRIEKLRQSHAILTNEAAGNTLFFAGVSHELRTPLNAIIGFSDMMRSRLFGPLPSKYAEYADMIHDSGQHMLDLIGDILDLSKVQAGKYSLEYDNFDAADVIRSSVKMVRPAADAAQVSFNVEIDPDDTLLVEADRKALRQILLNLFSNAIKFSEKGGNVSVLGKTDIGYLQVKVSDAGGGISAEDLVKIGTPFTQTASGLKSDERGSGLGLTLVKSLTELHRGEFDIQSEIGEGTVVTISLPLKRAT